MNSETRKIIANAVAGDMLAEKTILECILAKGLLLPKGMEFKDENGNVISATKIVLEKLVTPKFKKGDKIKDKNNRVWYVVQVSNKHFDISRVPDGTGYFVPMEDQDDYELSPDRELPKTYEKCYKVMNYCCNPVATKTTHKEELIRKFQFLLLYRDAYWKIAGEEMGLGKPWEPDWTNLKCDKFCILVEAGDISLKYVLRSQHILAFPSSEMRDAFYDNFEALIESCKELL